MVTDDMNPQEKLLRPGGPLDQRRRQFQALEAILREWFPAAQQLADAARFGAPRLRVIRREGGYPRKDTMQRIANVAQLMDLLNARHPVIDPVRLGHLTAEATRMHQVPADWPDNRDLVEAAADAIGVWVIAYRDRNPAAAAKARS